MRNGKGMIYMAGKNNLAYDLSRYEEYVERSDSKQNIKSEATAGPVREASAAPALVMLIIIAGVMFSLCISSKADIASVHAAIVTQEAAVRDLEQENVSMITRLEQKSSQKVVEDYAENILGMQKLDNAQVEYVSLESGNKVELAETSDDIFTKIASAFNDFVEYLKG